MASQSMQLSLREKLSFIPVIVQLPIVLLFAVVTKPFANTSRTLKRHISQIVLRFALGGDSRRVSFRQLRFILGLTVDTYVTWSRKHDVPHLVEPLVDGGALCWLGGRKSTERVIIYCHGGGYILPLDGSALDFLAAIQRHLHSNGIEDVAVALLAYSLVPDQSFPTQLRQAAAGLTQILGSGVPPSGIQLLGDSAGGNLILQILSHYLHPLASVPSLPKLASPLKGACLISPWVNLPGIGGSFERNSGKDLMPQRMYIDLGAQALKGVPDDQVAYLNFITNDESWWTGSERAFDRVLVTAGEDECLASDIATFVGALQKHHPKVTVGVQEGGVHNEPLPDFGVGEPLENHGVLSRMIMDWMLEGYKE